MPHEKFLYFFLRLRKQLDCNSDLAKYRVRNAIEWYYFLYTILLVIIYFASYFIYGYQDTLSLLWFIIYVISLVITIFRLMEILATFTMLHLNNSYHTDNPIRALMLTFISYSNIIIAFAVLFLVIGDFSGDNFSTTQLDLIAKDFITPLYFSIVTITTLGYGDLSPQFYPCKLLVVSQISIGILTIVIIVQRVMAVTKDEKDKIDKA